MNEMPLRRKSAVDSTVLLGPIALPNPIITASGTYGHGDEVARLGDPSKLGAVTVKSLSSFPWPGNPSPRVYSTPAGMLNSVGLQNPGVEHWIRNELPALRARGARVISSIWGRTLEDFAAAAAAIAPARDQLVALEVNVSCPNLEDRSRMFAHSAEATSSVVRAVVENVGGLPVFTKLSPNVGNLSEIAAAAVDAGSIGLTLVNTLMGSAIDVETRRFRLGAGGGGLSGPAIHPVAVRCVYETAQALPGTPIIGTGGVARSIDAVEMLLAGASAVGVGTATFRDPRAAEKIARDLSAWCDRHGVERIADLIGAAEPPGAPGPPVARP